jgi:hypothetical protein
MTEATWKRMLVLFEENERRFADMAPAPAMPKAKLCRESSHRTLGHLTACQAAWLPLMQQLRAGEPRGSVPINPDPLFTKLGFSTAAWETLLGRFLSERGEWRSILQQVDLDLEIRTVRRVHTARTLTKRLVEHEKRHLDNLTG